jgi:methyltransferase (TIGR00027 family)
MADSPIQSVSDTAFMVAAYRARETDRPDALFRDPLAARLIGEHGKRILDSMPRRIFMSGWSVVIRTCVIDRLIASAVAGGADLVLNLGAGLDTRPYRMDLPASLLWVEADLPRVVEFKESRLAREQPRCRLERVAIDLGDAPARGRFLAATAARAKRALVLTEGVVPYLTPEDVASLAADLRSHPEYANWIVDYFAPHTYRYRRRKGWARAMKNAPFRFEPEDFFGFFAGQGWRPREVRYLPEEGERLGRPIPWPQPLKLWVSIVRPLMSPERRATLGRFMGYVLLEPSDAAGR